MLPRAGSSWTRGQVGSGVNFGQRKSTLFFSRILKQPLSRVWASWVRHQVRSGVKLGEGYEQVWQWLPCVRGQFWSGKVISVFSSILKQPSSRVKQVYDQVMMDSAIIFAGVQSAAVNVICELARKNPKNYLSLAPLFFKLMTCSSNNWVLIKIIKLVGYRTYLAPLSRPPI